MIGLVETPDWKTSACSLGNVGAQEALSAGQTPELLVEVMLLAPLGILGHHLGLHETAGRRAENRQFFGHPG